MVGLRIIMNDTTRLRKNLEQMGDACKKNFDPVYNQIADIIRRRMGAIFRHEGAFAGNRKWANLSEPYGTYKERDYPNKTILRRTDRLYESLTVKGHKDNVVTKGPRSMTFGTKVPYAVWHQLRTKSMPARRISRLNLRQYVSKQFSHYLAKKAEQLGFRAPGNRVRTVVKIEPPE